MKASVCWTLFDHLKQQILLALSGENALLEAIPSLFPQPDEEVDQYRDALVLDCGGSTLKLALESYDSDNESFILDIIPFDKISMRSQHHYFQWIAEKCHDFLSRCQASQDIDIKLTFSYPMKMESPCKGYVLRWAKHLSFDLPCYPMESLMVALTRCSQRVFYPKVLCNDTTATLLAGQRKAGPCGVSCILGTGFNVGLFTTTIFNLEAGQYSHDYLNRVSYDYDLDLNSLNPNAQHLEKCIGGAYLGALVYYAGQSSGISISNQLSSEQVLAFYADHDRFRHWARGNAISQLQQDILLQHISDIVSRSAIYAACCVSAAYVIAETYHGRCSICIDGSLYCNNPQYKKVFMQYCEMLVGHFVVFT